MSEKNKGTPFPGCFVSILGVVLAVVSAFCCWALVP